ncbi:MAG: heme lyase CcmF/NrfE family subunit [Burkholderiales bacterium]|nr:heme lyase CcmF/NrfE family subunit [Burkholderiales bacterium]
MIPELGNFALVLALAVALLLAVVPMAGAARGRVEWMRLARPAAEAQCVLVAFAFACLAWSFAQNDFTVTYVASNSNSSLPLHYRLAAVWGGHEGSLLLWVLILTAWTLAVARLSNHLPLPVVARILSVMGTIAVGFHLFMLFTSNPFDRLLPGAPDGRDLNPLLQDPGMIFHPPMLYMGYVGFSVAFAFALAALIGGNLDATWARWSRPWTTVAWLFLTLGICLGSYWAYYELGWGGWWFWDPVENASFMPWLVGTALIHSLAVTERRNAFKAWTVLLAILAFSLSLLGTFLVRSGVLTSVHAFATDPKRGVFILAFLVVVVGGSLVLFAWRAARVGIGARFDMVSRESMLLTNNVLLLAAAGTVLLGTLYPLIIDALGVGKISVGPPYFEAVFAPLMAPAIFLMGVGPIARWREASLPELARRLRWAFAVALVLALIAPALAGAWKPLTSAGLLLAFWVVTSAWTNLRERAGTDWPRPAATLARWAALPGGYWGMLLAHLGVAVFIVGVTMVKSYERDADLRLAPGQSAPVGDLTVRFGGVREVAGPNYTAVRGELQVMDGDRVVAVLHPEKRIYKVQKSPMTEAAIDTSLARDLYVALGEPDGADAWIVRVHVKPFVVWIWLGCLLMALGGAIAVFDRRYRATARAAALAPAAGAPAGAA